MAKIKKGILGGFQGRIGNVVGSSWKGRDVMKSRPATVTNPNTESQQRQRARFGIAGRFVQAHRNAIRTGFGASAKGMTSSNAAMSYLLANAITGEYPDLSLDFSKIQISQGNLPLIEGISLVSENPAALNISWVDNSQLSGASAGDQLMVSISDQLTSEALFFPACSARNSGNVMLDLPATWSSRTIDVLLFMVSVDGSAPANSRNAISNTVYAGSVTLV